MQKRYVNEGFIVSRPITSSSRVANGFRRDNISQSNANRSPSPSTSTTLDDNAWRRTSGGSQSQDERVFTRDSPVMGATQAEEWALDRVLIWLDEHNLNDFMAPIKGTFEPEVCGFSN